MLQNFKNAGVLKSRKWGPGGGLVDRVADSSPHDPSLIPLGGKNENK